MPAASVSFLSGLAGHTGPLPLISLCEDLQLFAVLPPTLGQMHLWDSQLDLCKAQISVVGKKPLCCCWVEARHRQQILLSRVWGVRSLEGIRKLSLPADELEKLQL